MTKTKPTMYEQFIERHPELKGRKKLTHDLLVKIDYNSGRFGNAETPTPTAVSLARG